MLPQEPELLPVLPEPPVLQVLLPVLQKLRRPHLQLLLHKLFRLR